MTRKLVPLYVSLALVLGPPAAGASDKYAGLTRAEAVDKAESGVIALGVAIEGWTPEQASKFRHKLDAMPAHAKHSMCKGIRAWRVSWPQSDPIFVNRHGIVSACLFR